MQGGNDMQRPAASKLTYEDFLCFPDDGRRHELIDGEHFVTPSRFIVHQRLVGDVVVMLDRYFEKHDVGEVFVSPLDVVLSQHDIVVPDVVVVLGDQFDIITELNLRGSPAILVEVLSDDTRRRDETLKRQLYARTGVREYWMVDPDARRIVVCRSASPEPDATLEADSDDVLTSSLLPGFELPLKALFDR